MWQDIGALAAVVTAIIAVPFAIYRFVRWLSRRGEHEDLDKVIDLGQQLYENVQTAWANEAPNYQALVAAIAPWVIEANAAVPKRFRTRFNEPIFNHDPRQHILERLARLRDIQDSILAGH